MRCPDCRKAVALSERFCPYCGAALPKAGQKSEEQPAPQERKQFIFAAAAAAVITLLCFLALRLIAGGMLSSFGDLMAQGFREAAGAIRFRAFALAAAGFAVSCVLIFLNKNGWQSLYYIAWGALCAVGVLFLSFINPQAVMMNRKVTPEIFQYAVVSARALAFSFGLGVPLLQAALYLCFHRPVSGKNSAVVMALFFAGASGGMWLGMSVLDMGMGALLLSAMGSIPAFAASVILNRRKAL